MTISTDRKRAKKLLITLVFINIIAGVMIDYFLEGRVAKVSTTLLVYVVFFVSLGIVKPLLVKKK